MKPTQRFSTSDWFASNDFISTNAERQRVASHQIRQEARALVNGKIFQLVVQTLCVLGDGRFESSQITCFSYV